MESPPKTPGIQELLALLCVLNAKLSRAEFRVLLQASMRFQKEQVSETDARFRPQLTSASYLIGPATASRALGHHSTGPVGGFPAIEGSETQFESSDGEQQVQPLASAAGTSSHTPSRERTRSIVHKSLNICSVELHDLDTRSKEVRHTVEQALATVNSWTGIQPDEAAVAALAASLRTAAAQTAVMVS